MAYSICAYTLLLGWSYDVSITCQSRDLNVDLFLFCQNREIKKICLVKKNLVQVKENHECNLLVLVVLEINFQEIIFSEKIRISLTHASIFFLKDKNKIKNITNGSDPLSSNKDTLISNAQTKTMYKSTEYLNFR